MTPLIRQDGPAAREYARDCRQDTDPAVRPGTAPAGAGNEAAVTAASVPPLSGGPGSHGSAAAHAFTIAGSADGDLCPRRWLMPKEKLLDRLRATSGGPTMDNLARLAATAWPRVRVQRVLRPRSGIAGPPKVTSVPGPQSGKLK
jgi:hypothetical protein